MTTNSEPPEAEASQADSDLAAERLAYSVDEAARLVGLSRDLLYDQMRCGNLPFVKVGRRRLITRQHLQRSSAWRPSDDDELVTVNQQR